MLKGKNRVLKYRTTFWKDTPSLITYKKLTENCSSPIVFWTESCAVVPLKPSYFSCINTYWSEGIVNIRIHLSSTSSRNFLLWIFSMITSTSVYQIGVWPFLTVCRWPLCLSLSSKPVSPTYCISAASIYNINYPCGGTKASPLT